MCDDPHIKSIAEERTWGTLYGIGVGPGNPELLTLKAFCTMQKAERIFVPRAGKSGSSLAQHIVEELLEEHERDKFRELHFPMSRDEQMLRNQWRYNAECIVASCRCHETTAFLTLGDPAIYSTYAYLVNELATLAPELPIVTIPGVPTLNLAAARFNVPLTTGTQQLALTPLPERIEELSDLLRRFDTVVIYKIGNRIGELRELIAREGLENACYFAERAGMPNEVLAAGLHEIIDNQHNGYLSTMIVKTGERLK